MVHRYYKRNDDGTYTVYPRRAHVLDDQEVAEIWTREQIIEEAEAHGVIMIPVAL